MDRRRKIYTKLELTNQIPRVAPLQLNKVFKMFLSDKFTNILSAKMVMCYMNNIPSQRYNCQAGCH